MMAIRKSTAELGTDTSATGLNIFLYLRVSTGRQAETDLSIPDQRRQIEAWAAARSYKIVGEYVDAATATDDKRPLFQSMIEHACNGEHHVDAIAVHSYSRFFRAAFEQEFYLRKLRKHGVRLISITQELSDDDPGQDMMRKVIALFDEYQSKENAKHVLRSMKENAARGYWNGSRPPFGYETIEVDRKGARIKKRLAIDIVEAEVVRLIFKLFLEGDNGSGPMGVKAVANWLNEHGYRTRANARWGIGPLHKLITNPVYAGHMRFNCREARTGRRKAESEHVSAIVPAIVDPNLFEEVQSQLKARNPKVNPPRVVTGPILLTGLAVCASCNGGMTLRTGTSKSGRVYKYYTCATCARAGNTACKGRSIRMDKLDSLVTNKLIDRLLAPERLEVMLAALAGRRAERSAVVDQRITDLEVRAAEAHERLKRLYKMVEDGLTDLDDILKDRITTLKADRDSARAAVARARGANRPPIVIEQAKIEAFGRLMREGLTTGEIPFRKAYLGAIIDRIEVDDHQIRIKGRKDVLEQAVLVNGAVVPGVRSFVRRWRTGQDSNPRPPDS